MSFTRVLFRRCHLRTSPIILAITLLLGWVHAADTVGDPDRYLNDIKTLTTPSMEGRGAGTKGLTRAEHYIEHTYKTIGMHPVPGHSYGQAFTLTTGAK